MEARGRASCGQPDSVPLGSLPVEQGTAGSSQTLGPDPFPSSSLLLWANDALASRRASGIAVTRGASPHWAESLTQGTPILSPSPKYVN